MQVVRKIILHIWHFQFRTFYIFLTKLSISPSDDIL